MAKNIEPNLKLISDYLKLKKDENFVIPEYQRAYSWEIEQCDKLWQDIESFISSGANDPYFFGTIIVDCSNTNKFSLIDGQQRTSTFLLLLKALLLRINEVLPNIPEKDEESKGLKAGLEARRNTIMTILYKAEAEEIPSMLKDHSKIKNIPMLENKSINELYPDEIKKIVEAINFDDAEHNVYKMPRKQKDNKYTNYFKNFKFFYNKLKDKSDSQLNQFARTFLSNCQIIEIRSWQIEQAITMFNSLNSTGMPLTDSDIISAQLYANAGEKKSEFNKQWEEINRLANELSNRKIIDVNSVLQQFMYINRALNKEYIIKEKKDGKDIIDVTTPGLRRYYIDIKKDLLDEPLEFCNNLMKIVKIWDKVKDYPLVKLLLKFNENIKLFLVGFLYRFEPEEITEDSISEICECLIRLFSILEVDYTGYSSNKFKTFLLRVMTKFVDININVREIKKDFNEHIISNWGNEKDKDNLKKAILEYNKNILVFLNEYLYARNKGKKFNFSESVNIEHIIPLSGRNISVIQKDAGITEPEEFKNIVNQLGNKILLEEDINKSISNEWFKTKKQTSVKDKTGYKDSVYTIAQSLTSYPKDVWKKEDVEEATTKATERILQFIFNTQN
ncbi:MAG TPA: DUF262 domain-containing HNH endonuclease family protein [Ignavibacteria bacterium]